MWPWLMRVALCGRGCSTSLPGFRFACYNAINARDG